MLICNHIEAVRSVWVMGPSSGKEQQCGSHAKLSRHRYMCAKSARAWARKLVEALGTSDAKNSLLCWMVVPPWRPFLVRRRNHISVDVLSLILCSDRYLIWQTWPWVSVWGSAVLIEKAGDVCGSKFGVSKQRIGWGVHYLLMDLCVEVVGLWLSCLWWGASVVCVLLSVAVVGVLCRWAKFVGFGCLRDLGAPLREPMCHCVCLGDLWRRSCSLCGK